MQLKDLSQGKSERYADDPAYTEDVRHLAMPMRRNSGPESSRRKSCSILDGPTFQKNTGNVDMNQSTRKKYSDSYNKYEEKLKSRLSSRNERLLRCEDDSSSSDECNYNRRGQSLDRSVIKQQKRSLCFPRDRDGNNSNRRLDKISQRKEASMENLFSRNNRYSSNDFASQSRMYKDDVQNRSKDERNQNNYALDQYAGSKEDALSYNDSVEREKSKESSKFQIGKRFLRGEIGIKSFNYYLLKEGLKTNKKDSSKSSTAVEKISKSEENIYEELHFTQKRPTQKQMSYPECELCIQECTNKNCEICKVTAERAMIRTLPTKSKRASEERAQLEARTILSNSNENIHSLAQMVPNVLQYQSYNPENPGVYKIETTPVAFTSDYNPMDEIYNKQKSAPHKRVQNKKSSSSSDSLHHNKYVNATIKPELYDCLIDAMCNQKQNLLKPQIYKTDSRASIISEMSIKSENSNRYYRPAEMSDSSMGDSMFSYSQQRRYFGSAESCRFGYECRRCSFDGEKCSFSDNCRYECRNCDCSSSYFSSDFDDGNFSRKSSARMSNQSQISYYDDTTDTKTSRYAEDFIKHITNVKKSSIYQTKSTAHPSAMSSSAAAMSSEPTPKAIKHVPLVNQDMTFIKNNPVYGSNTGDYEFEQVAPRSPRRDRPNNDGNSNSHKAATAVVAQNTQLLLTDPIDNGILRKEDLEVKYYHKDKKKSSLSSKSSNSSKSDSSINRATGTIPKINSSTANIKDDDLKHLSPYEAHPAQQQQQRNVIEMSEQRISNTKMYIKKPEIVDGLNIVVPKRDRPRAYLNTDTDDENDDVFEDELRSRTGKKATVSIYFLYIYIIT